MFRLLWCCVPSALLLLLCSVGCIALAIECVTVLAIECVPAMRELCCRGCVSSAVLVQNAACAVMFS